MMFGASPSCTPGIVSEQFVFTPIELKGVYQPRRHMPGFLRARHRVVLAGNERPRYLDPKETVAIINIIFQSHFIAALTHFYGRDDFLPVNSGDRM